jgi:hypothetical protein
LSLTLPLSQFSGSMARRTVCKLQLANNPFRFKINKRTQTSAKAIKEYNHQLIGDDFPIILPDSTS